MRAAANRRWAAALAARARRLPSTRAAAPPDHPPTGRETAGTGAVGMRRTRPTTSLARVFASPVNRVALALLAIAALYRLVLIVRGWPALDSDEAIIGLMARHIQSGQYPYWFWGQKYMGAFQAYVVAAVFTILGSSTFAQHLTMLLFTLGFLAAMYGLGRAAYGPAVGLLTLAWLAIGPPVGVLRELTAIGGYQDMLLFSALVLLGVWSRLRQPAKFPRTGAEGRRALLVYAGIGLAGGIGLWSDLLILPVLVLAAYALLAVRTREVFSICGVVLVVAFLCGGYPYISYNITNHNATYKQIVRQSHPDGNSSQVTLPARGAWLNQIGETFAVAVPAVLASPHVCINQGNVWPAIPPAEAEVSASAPGACDNVNTVFSLAAIFIYLTVAWQLLVVFWRWLTDLAARLLTRSRGPSSSASADAETAAPGFALTPDETASLWLRLMMLGIAAMTLGLYTINQDAQRYQYTSSRYLLPLYVTTPLLFGPLWELAAPRLRPLLAAMSGRVLAAGSRSTLDRRGTEAPAHRTQDGRKSDEIAADSAGTIVAGNRESSAPSQGEGAGSRVGPLLASLALLLLLALSIGGGLLTLGYALGSRQFALPEPQVDRDLIAFLDGHHISSYYSDYWTCYRVMFETNERITCAVRGQNGDVGLELINNRNDAYIQQVAQAPHPAYILPTGTAEDANFAAEATAQSLPHDGYQRVVLDGLAIYYHP